MIEHKTKVLSRSCKVLVFFLMSLFLVACQSSELGSSGDYQMTDTIKEIYDKRIRAYEAILDEFRQSPTKNSWANIQTLGIEQFENHPSWAYLDVDDDDIEELVIAYLYTPEHPDDLRMIEVFSVKDGEAEFLDVAEVHETYELSNVVEADWNEFDVDGLDSLIPGANITAILDGDLSSIAGKWMTKTGESLVFSDSHLEYINDKSTTEGQTILLKDDVKVPQGNTHPYEFNEIILEYPLEFHNLRTDDYYTMISNKLLVELNDEFSKFSEEGKENLRDNVDYFKEKFIQPYFDARLARIRYGLLSYKEFIVLPAGTHGYGYGDSDRDRIVYGFESFPVPYEWWYPDRGYEILIFYREDELSDIED